MGKRVFEVAKDLGVDHRDLLNKCDALDIKVRNYMSVLSDGDEARLRNAYDGGRKVVERVQAPGVVRRRRVSGKRDRAPNKPSTPARGPARPQQASPRPAGASRVGPVRRAAEPARRKPADEQPSPRPATPKVETPAPSPRPAAPAEAKAPVKTPAAPEPVSKVLYRPPTEPKPAAAPPKRDVPKTVVARQPVPELQNTPGGSVEGGRKPSGDKPSPRPAASRSVEPETRRAAPEKRAEVTSPRRRESGAQARTSGASPRPAGGAQIRKPAPRENTGAAKILGRIPLEQLQRRTTRGPTRRSGPGRGRPSGVRRSGGPPRGPGGPPRGPGGPMMPPPAAGTADGRRRRTAGGPSGGRDRQRGGSNRNTSRRRRVFNREDIYKGGSHRSGRGRRRKMSSRKGAKTQLTTPAAHKRVVRIDDTISLGELGKEMGVKANDLIRKLMGMGTMATINQQIDVDTAALLAEEYDYEVKNVAFQEDDVLSGPTDDEASAVDPDAVPRAPVVTIMGHVDHGKTTLLDRIRKANVAEGEAGGITQHIGAYKVNVGDGPGVVFLDTPGHAAFTAMRARGASVTDIVVLIVAADDGPMPQTVESINHAKAAGVPLVVAINKIDKPGVDPERIKQSLTQYELVPEEWGGDTMFVPVSALTGQGIDDLLEALSLQAEVLELKANPKKPAYGRVVEARVEKGRGTVCTVLVQEGTLKAREYIVSGNHYGRVRALIDNSGKRIKTAGPSTPVEVLGLGGMPAAGDAFYTASNEKDAKKVVDTREEREVRAAVAAAAQGQSPMERLAALTAKDKEVQTLILKTDVSGSLEALRGAVEQLSTDEVEVKLVHAAVGNISESDVDLAVASNAVIVGFNTKPDNKSKRAADQAGIQILTFSVIYDVLDTMKEMLSGLLSPEEVEEHLGWAEVRAVFHIQKVGTVAGCFVTDGKILRNAQARVHRGGEVIHTGKLSTLKRFKDDVREVSTGYECGLSVDGYKDVQEGDRVEVFELKQIKRSID